MTCTKHYATDQNSLPHYKATISIWLPVALKKKIPDIPTKTCWSWISERSPYPLQNCVCFSPLTSRLDFWPKIYFLCS